MWARKLRHLLLHWHSKVPLLVHTFRMHKANHQEPQHARPLTSVHDTTLKTCNRGD